MKRYKNYVTLPYDPVWRPLDWAKQHCPSYITNAVHDDVFSGMPDNTKIDYFFSNEHDMLMFALRWS